MVLVGARDSAPVERLLADAGQPGMVTAVSTSGVHDARQLPGFAAVDGGAWIGLATYRISGGECELVTLHSLRERSGIGIRLLGAVVDAARDAGCRRVWVITTNDNLGMMRFIQRRGFALAAVHRDFMNRVREGKPEVPLTGHFGIPLRDALEFELRLSG